MKKQSEKNEKCFTTNTHFSFFSVHYAINAPIKKYFHYPLPVDLSPPTSKSLHICQPTLIVIEEPYKFTNLKPHF